MLVILIIRWVIITFLSIVTFAKTIQDLKNGKDTADILVTLCGTGFSAYIIYWLVKTVNLF